MSSHGPWAKIGWFGVALVIGGCVQDAPPYDDLPLRDALRASPEVIASLSFDTRRDLALRLDNAALEQETETTLTADDVSMDALARAADAARDDEDVDALVMGELSPRADDVVLRTELIDNATVERAVVGPLFLQGVRSTSTAALEDVALRGRAGKWLRALSERTGASRMVRTTGLPMGAWTYEDTLYVNASWLVAMAALEEGGTLPMNAPATKDGVPGKTPLTVDFNPYTLPSTVLQCRTHVIDKCQCGTSCTHDVTDPAFIDANAECAWVNADSTHPTALCVLALLSVSDVRVCMEVGASHCVTPPITTHDEAASFAQRQDCVDLLNICLSDGSIPVGFNPTCNTCNACSGCNNNCSNPSPCSGCNQNCSNSNQSGTGCGRCSVKPEQSRAPLPTPIGDLLWLLAPLAYVTLRARRQS